MTRLADRIETVTLTNDPTLLLQALECYRKRNGTMRLCADYPTARCNAADCARTGCAKVYQLMRGVVPRGDASDG